MTLYKKTLLIMGASLACLLIVLYVSSRLILLDGLSGIEQAAAADNTRRSLNTISDDIDSLARASRDWARSSDTYAYIVNGANPHLEEKLADGSTWASNDVNVMLFIDNDGRIVREAGYDLENMKPGPVPASLDVKALSDRTLTDHPETDCAIAGIMMLPEGPMMVTSVPIIANGSDTPAGNLVWGSYINDAKISSIETTTLTGVSLARADSNELPADMREALDARPAADSPYIKLLDEDVVGSYSVIDDIYGDPALVMRVDTPRDVYGQAERSIVYLVATIAVVGLFFGIGIIIPLNRVLIRRMKAIGSTVRKAASTGEISIRLDSGGNDELSMLAGDINRMLAALELSHGSLGRINVELEERVRDKTMRLQQKIEVLQALAEIDREIIAADDSAAIQSLICQRIAGMTQAKKVLIVMKDTDGIGRVTASHGLDSQNPRYEELEQLFSTGMLEDLGAGQHAIGFNSVTAYDFYLPELIARENAHSLALAPLTLDSRQMGVLLVIDNEPREWDDEELQVLGLLADQVALGITTARLFEEEKTTRQELASLYRLSRELADTSPDIDAILSIVARTAVDTVNITYCRIALLEGEELSMRSAYPRRILGTDLKVGYGEPVSSLAHCRRILRQNAPVILHADQHILSCHERDVIFLGGAQTVCVVPLATASKPLGLMILSEARDERREPFTASKLELASNIGDQASSALKRAELFSELEHSYMQTVLSLANAVDARDSYTSGHGQVMAHMALAIGSMYNLPSSVLDTLHYAALLHDIGKIGVTDSILRKPSELNEKEWVEMRRHPAVGEQIMSSVPYLEDASLIVRHHHEHFDGSGYPDGLSGNTIPLGSRILAIVDSYCAMRDRRVYKDPVSHEEALLELRDCAGTQFDPEIVATFIRLTESGIINIENRLGHHFTAKPRDDTEAA
ncbi:MAG: HD domain-containing phosphohydrolase [Thermoleophilia bacterium]